LCTKLALFTRSYRDAPSTEHKETFKKAQFQSWYSCRLWPKDIKYLRHWCPVLVPLRYLHDDVSNWLSYFVYVHSLTAPVGLGLLMVEISKSHSRTSHAIRLLWTSDQPVAETSIWLTHSTHNRQTSMPQAEFEPAIPGSERPQTHALDRAATAHSTYDNLSSRTKGSKHVVPRCPNIAIQIR
jgi:hypothetical protein